MGCSCVCSSVMWWHRLDQGSPIEGRSFRKICKRQPAEEFKFRWMYVNTWDVASLTLTIDLAYVVSVEDSYASAQTTFRKPLYTLPPFLEQAAWITGWTFDVQADTVPPPKCLMLWTSGSPSWTSRYKWKVFSTMNDWAKWRSLALYLSGCPNCFPF